MGFGYFDRLGFGVLILAIGGREREYEFGSVRVVITGKMA